MLSFEKYAGIDLNAWEVLLRNGNSFKGRGIFMRAK